MPRGAGGEKEGRVQGMSYGGTMAGAGAYPEQKWCPTLVIVEFIVEFIRCGYYRLQVAVLNTGNGHCMNIKNKVYPQIGTVC